jgi:hypothetical protein
VPHPASTADAQLRLRVGARRAKSARWRSKLTNHAIWLMELIGQKPAMPDRRADCEHRQARPQRCPALFTPTTASVIRRRFKLPRTLRNISSLSCSRRTVRPLSASLRLRNAFMHGTSRSSCRRGLRMRVPAEEAHHLPGRIRPMLVGIRSSGSSAGPGVTGSMDHPLLDDGLTSLVGVDHPAIRMVLGNLASCTLHSRWGVLRLRHPPGCARPPESIALKPTALGAWPAVPWSAPSDQPLPIIHWQTENTAEVSHFDHGTLSRRTPGFPA